MNALLRLRTDRQLLALLRAGSDDAFTVLHDRYRPRLLAYVRRMLHRWPHEDAEDVLQEVFVRAHRSLLADEREIHVSGWLYRIARNCCLDHLRSRPQPPVAEAGAAPDPFEVMLAREEFRSLVAGIDRLPPRQRSVLVLREFSGVSHRDLADSLGVSVPAIKSLLMRARAGLEPQSA